MPRRNRVDPWGDLHAVESRGLFTGNRGCLVDDDRRLVRHHNGNLWITCLTRYRLWRSPLDAPHHWTPLFFLDDAVALAAGHRPCGLCRRADYLAYQAAVAHALDRPPRSVGATELNRRLASERVRAGQGLVRWPQRRLWVAPIDGLPAGTVIVDPHSPTPPFTQPCTRPRPAPPATCLVGPTCLQGFGFAGWGEPRARPKGVEVEVLTPAVSVSALAHGFLPALHLSARRAV